MRSLPFSNGQIAAAFSAIAALVSVGFGGDIEERDARNRFYEARGNGIIVEFAYADGSFSKGYATEQTLRSAVRGDLKNLLVPEYQELIEKKRWYATVFWLIRDPSLLLEFEPLVDIFARDLIPSQLVLGREPTLFNPAALKIFSLP
jgi:hypothetical protein